MPTILLVEDNAFNRNGMKAYLHSKGFQTLEAADRATAWRIARQESPDLLIIDIVIPATPNGRLQRQASEGVNLALQVKEQYPQMGIVLFSAYEDRGKAILELVRRGTRGIAYQLKGIRPSTLLHVINQVQAGQVVIDEEVSDRQELTAVLRAALRPEEITWVEHALAHCDTLTPREMDVARRIASAQTIANIAVALGIAIKTVEGHASRVYSKLGLNETAPPLRPAIVLAKACLLHELSANQNP